MTVSCLRWSYTRMRIKQCICTLIRRQVGITPVYSSKFRIYTHIWSQIRSAPSYRGRTRFMKSLSRLATNYLQMLLLNTSSNEISRIHVEIKRQLTTRLNPWVQSQNKLRHSNIYITFACSTRHG